MVGHEDRFGLIERAQHGLQLLRGFKAVAIVLNHLDNCGEMALCAFEAVEQVGVVGVAHITS